MSDASEEPKNYFVPGQPCHDLISAILADCAHSSAEIRIQIDKDARSVLIWVCKEGSKKIHIIRSGFDGANCRHSRTGSLDTDVQKPKLEEHKEKQTAETPKADATADTQSSAVATLHGSHAPSVTHTGHHHDHHHQHQKSVKFLELLAIFQKHCGTSE